MMSSALKPETGHARSVGNSRALGHPLDAIFAPGSVAVFGAVADPQSVARVALNNLANRPIANGNIYTIGERCADLTGIRTRARIEEVPEPIDLAVIASPAAEVPAIVKQCAHFGVRGAIILSEGFSDAGPEGGQLEQRVLAEARQGPMRIIGPKSLGVIRPFSGLNASAASVTAWPGKIAFLSESRALCNAILDLRLRERAGFSALVSVGTMVDVDWGDLIDYLENDPYTASIVIYMKTLGRAESFVSAASRVALKKPIVVLKAGRTEGGTSQPRASNDSDQVLDAVFRRSGVLRIRRLSDLFDMADVLTKQPYPNGPRLTILTNAEAPALLAADALLTSGGQLASLSAETLAGLDRVLDTRWSRGNPVDIRDDSAPDRFVSAVELVANDPGTDGLLLILAPHTRVDSTLTAEGLRGLAHAARKPILASWMGGVGVLAGQDVLAKAGIPTFMHPDTAARAFRYLWKHSQNIQSLCAEKDSEEVLDLERSDQATAERIGRGVRHSGREVLDLSECRGLLTAYGLPAMPVMASSADEAASLAAQVGFPVMLQPIAKPMSESIAGVGLHPDSYSGDEVRSNYARLEESVRRRLGQDQFLGVTFRPIEELAGCELTVGSRSDREFGPVVHFRLGWSPSAGAHDVSLGLPPLSRALARQMLERTRFYKLLQATGERSSVDVLALEQCLSRFSRLVVEQSWIREIELSLLLTSPGRLWTERARAVTWGAETFEDEWPRPVFAR